MCQEFTTLRLKDNLSLKNKRLRCNEVVSSLLTAEFSKRLNKLISLGEKATIDNYRDMFKFPGDRNMSPETSLIAGTSSLCLNYETRLAII